MKCAAPDFTISAATSWGRFEIVAFKPSPAPAVAGFVAILFPAFEPDSSLSRLRCPTSAEEAGAPQAGLDFIFRRGALMI
jgi:hypothetical protein